MPDFLDKADIKRELRRKLLAARRARPTEDLARAAAKVRRTVTELVREHGPVVATYVPIGTEPGGRDLPAALAALLPAGGLLLPVLRPDLDLDWAAWPSGEPLVAAGRGMREPRGPRLGRGGIVRARVVIVPGLAVDRRGRRLGRGGGSYDRALARVGPDVLTVALLHDGEFLDSVPAEAHDQRVRAVVTPTDGLVRLDEEPSDGALLALG